MTKRDKVFVDVETTGLDAWRATDDGTLVPHHEIIELAAIRTTPDDVPTIAMSRKVAPRRIELAAKQALATNGYRESAWQDATPLARVLSEFAGMSGDCVMYAWNVTFDWSFLHVAFAMTGVENTMHYHRKCVMSYVNETLGANHSLASACEELDIKPEPDVHRALAGAEKCLAAYKAIRARGH